jgi:hypothetical protein
VVQVEELGVARSHLDEGGVSPDPDAAAELLDVSFQAAVDREQEVELSTGYLGTHDYPNTDPELDGIFLAWGYGIRHGHQLQRITNLDIAPTIAKLLNVEMPTMDGRVLHEILNQKLFYGTPAIHLGA